MNELKVTFYLKKNEERADGTMPILGRIRIGKFYLKKNEERADGTMPILGRIRIGKSMVQFSTKVYVIPSLWDVKSGRAVGKSKPAAATNKELDRIALDIHSAYKDLLAKKENVSALEVKNAFQGISSEQETLVSFYGKCNERFL